jgi:hypothetical protein
MEEIANRTTGYQPRAASAEKPGAKLPGSSGVETNFLLR